jgi:hypothetical protein
MQGQVVRKPLAGKILKRTASALWNTIRFAGAMRRLMVMPVQQNVQALLPILKALVKKLREAIDPEKGRSFEGRQIFISIVGSKQNLLPCPSLLPLPHPAYRYELIIG